MLQKLINIVIFFIRVSMILNLEGLF